MSAVREFRVTIDSNVTFIMKGGSETEIMEQIARTPVLYVNTPDTGMLRVNVDNVTTIAVREKGEFGL